MKKIIQLILTSALLLSLVGCMPNNEPTITPTSDTIIDTAFDEYMDKAIIDILTNDYHAIHVYFEKPEDFGINKNELNVGFDSGLNEEVNDKIFAQYEDIKEKLEAYDYDKLQDYQKDMYDSFMFDYELMEEGNKDKYEYLSSAFETSRGSYISYPTLLADWIVRSEKDYKDLIVLVNDLKRIFEEEIAYTIEQAENGYMHINFEDTISYCQNIVDKGMDSSVLTSLLNKIDNIEVSDEVKESLKLEMKTAFEKSYLVGYKFLVSELTKLRDGNYDNNEAGLYYLQSGRDYYELLLKQAMGMDISVEELLNMMQTTMNKYIQKMSMIYRLKPDVLSRLDADAYTSYDDVAAMLLDLEEDILLDFPDVGEIEYEIAPIDPAIANENTAAYFNIPAVDGTYPKQIRVNTNDGQLNVKGIDTFQTIAHEGLPGHMYQIYYNYLNAPTLFLKVNSCLAYTEGYATYVENYVSKYLEDEVEKAIVDILVCNNIITGCIYVVCDVAINYQGYAVDETQTLLKELGIDVDLETTQAIYNQLRDNPTIFVPYYAGFAKIDMMKDKVKTALGDNYNEMEFHRVLLDNAGRTLEVVERNIDKYIEVNK